MKKNDLHQKILSQYSNEIIINELEPYLTDRRKQRINEVLSRRIRSIHLAIESPCDLNNALAALRTAEALGVANVHIISPEGKAGSARRVTRGSYYWLDIHHHPSTTEFLKYIDNNRISLAGGTVNATTPLHEVPLTSPICIIIGNENRGLSSQSINALSHQYKITMHGMVESLNLSVAAAISLYDVTQRKRSSLEAGGDLTKDEIEHGTAKFYLNSVQNRILRGLFNQINPT